MLDMDGTLFDSDLDWVGIRDRIGVPRDGRPILEQLKSAESSVRQRGLEILIEAEHRGAENGRLIPGAKELLEFFHLQGIRTALVTNNSRHSAEVLLARHPLAFDLILTRDEGAAKPDPEVFVRALVALGAAPDEAIAIGDAHIDVLAAHHAGVSHIILVGADDWAVDLIPAGICYRRADALDDVLRMVAATLEEPDRDAP
jgi:HAD superfamily hydrolase (TIGR01549 family)